MVLPSKVIVSRSLKNGLTEHALSFSSLLNHETSSFESQFISFSALEDYLRKRNHAKFLFQSFLDSLNMKRLPSNLASFHAPKSI